MQNPSIKEGVLGLVTEVFRKLPDLVVIFGAMVALFLLLALALMWSGAD